MGFSINSKSSHDVDSKTAFGRLKPPAAGNEKGKPANGAPLVLTAQDVAPASTVSHPGPSVISSNVEMTGSLTSPNELHIYGAVDGNVRAADLTIFAGGSVKGEVIAENVLVHGTVDGRIQAKKVQLCAGAVMRGDIVHASLGVDTGSTFEGVSKRSENPMAEMKPAAKRNGSAATATAAATAASEPARYSSPA
jgi:cytoskeletal protein CcmA (bactofilin family)